jgi:hypothetical protein
VAVAASSYAVAGSTDASEKLASAGNSVHETAQNARAADRAHLPNPLLWAAVLTVVTGTSDAHDPDVDQALRRTTDLAELDPNVQMLRSRVYFRRGEVDTALRLAERVVQRTKDSRPDLLAGYAELLNEAGRRAEAVGLLTASIQELAVADFRLPDNVWRLVEALQQIAGASSPEFACSFEQARRAFGAKAQPVALVSPRQRCST